jgi:hypothetical protein
MSISSGRGLRARSMAPTLFDERRAENHAENIVVESLSEPSTATIAVCVAGPHSRVHEGLPSDF